MRRLLLMAALTVVALAACGDDDGEGGGSALPGNGGDVGEADGGGDGEVCELLTAAEVEAAVGNAVEDGTGVDPNVCDWASGRDVTSVRILLLEGVAPELCSEGLESDPASERVDAIDEPAFWSSGVVGVGSIVVCAERGQLQLTVTAGIDDPDDEDRLRGAAEELTELALSRL